MTKPEETKAAKFSRRRENSKDDPLQAKARIIMSEALGIDEKRVTPEMIDGYILRLSRVRLAI